MPGRTWIPLVVCCGLLAAGAVSAQSDLGGQRVATSSGSFLKIGLDARGAGLGGSYDAMAEGPASVFYNPAGMLYGSPGPSVRVGLVQWPGDLQISSIATTFSSPHLAGRFGLGLAYLGTSFEETTEYYPTGTGRNTSYSDFLGSFSFARAFTDRLGIGITAKYFREDLASNLGGPVVQGFLLDAGTAYSLGYRNARLAVTLSHFGPDLKPAGSFTSNVLNTSVAYSSFSPPTQFHLGFCIDAISRGAHTLTTVGHIVHQADNAETFRAGLEYKFRGLYALRAGYDFQADEMALSAGAGLKLRIGSNEGSVDYAYTEGGHLAAVHRWGVGFAL